MEDNWLEGPADTPGQITEACKTFFCDYMSYMTFIAEVFSIAKSADESNKMIVEFASRLKTAAPKSPAKSVKEGGPYIGLLSVYEHLIAEFVWCRGVDNFLTYISQLWGLVFRSRPETMKSQRQECLEVILNFKTIEELIDHLAEKRVHDLSYQGMAKLQASLKKELGFALFTREDRLQRAILIIEDRNLIAHNRGVVNNLYIQRTGAGWARPGMAQKPGLLCAQRCMRFLANAALDIDVRAVAKFTLPVVSLEEECHVCIAKAHETVPPLPTCGTFGNTQSATGDGADVSSQADVGGKPVPD